MADEIAISIEETNRLRASLGLKPLKVDDGSSSNKKKEEAEAARKAAEREEKERKEEEYADKIAALKKQRKLETLTMKEKGLGEPEDDDDSAAAWIRKSRIAEQELKRKQRLLAAKKARELEEREQEIYGEKDLMGMTISHTESEFKEGQAVILTLKDAPILRNTGNGISKEENEEEDELENISMAEIAKKKRAEKESKRSIRYDATDTSEFGPDGRPKEKTLLQYYDELPEDEKAVIGKGALTAKKAKGSNSNNNNNDEDTTANEIRERLRTAEAQPLNLNSSQQGQIHDYYTKEEMAAFAKKKSSKKLKKKKTKLVEEEEQQQQQQQQQVEGVEQEDGGDGPVIGTGVVVAGAAPSAGMASATSLDHGSRLTRDQNLALKRQEAIELAEEKAKRYKRALAMASEQSMMILSGIAAEQQQQQQQQQQDQEHVIGEEDESELGEALARARRAKLQRPKQQFSEVAAVKKEERDDDAAMKDAKSSAISSSVTFTSTSEFCRNLHGMEEKKAIKQESAATMAAAAKPEVLVAVKREIKEEPADVKMEDGETETAVTVKAEEDGVEDEHLVMTGKKRKGGYVHGDDEEDSGRNDDDEDDEDDEDDDDEEEGEARVRPSAGARKKPQRRGIAAGSSKGGPSRDAHVVAGVLTSEPVAAKGMSAALELARQRGFLQQEVAGRSNDDKEYHNRMDKEDEDIRLDRFDEFGRPITIKEAWRQMCWSFHGIKPSAKRQEKRLRKIRDEFNAKKAVGGNVDGIIAVHEKVGSAALPLTGKNIAKVEKRLGAKKSKK